MHTKAVVAFCVSWLLTGCLTSIEVKKFTGDEPGLRYSLPQPFLYVTPKTDGSIDVQVVYLPDPDSEYVVTWWSFLSGHTVDVSLEDSFLKKVSLKTNDTAAIAQLAESAGNVLQKRFEAETTAEEARKQQIKDAQKEVSEASTELRSAEAELQILKQAAAAPGAGDMAADIRNAEIKVAKARIRLEVAQARLQTAGTSSFNLGNDGNWAYGPVLFKIEENRLTGGVNLKAVADQERYLTSKAPSVGESHPELPEFNLKGSSVIRPVNNQIQFTFVSTDPVKDVGQTVKSLINDTTGDDLAGAHSIKITPQQQGQEFIVDLDKRVPDGSYTFEFSYVYKRKGKEGLGQDELSIEIRRQ